MFYLLTALKSSSSKSSGVSSKFSLNINKENKKYSPGANRVKKLSRTPIRIAGSKGMLQIRLTLNQFLT